MAELLFEQVAALSEQIAGLEKEIRSRTRAREDMKRLMMITGIGPICAMALHAYAPPMENFGCGSDFAAWVGLTPRQHSAAGKQRLGRITKMGQRDLRQLPSWAQRRCSGICASARSWMIPGCGG